MAMLKTFRIWFGLGTKRLHFLVMLLEVQEVEFMQTSISTFESLMVISKIINGEV